MTAGPRNSDVCSIIGCSNKYRSRGLCSRHYAQARRGSLPMPTIWDPPARETLELPDCSVAGCAETARSRSEGLCRTHRSRKWRLGSVDLPTRLTAEERFWSKVRPTGFCWEWAGAHDSMGYGIFTSENREVVRSHRVAFTLLVGQIPPGLHIDHLCRNKGCCNPDHLEPVTPSENSRRSREIRSLGNQGDWLVKPCRCDQ